MVSKMVRATSLVSLAIALFFVLASTGCGDKDKDTIPPIIANVEVTDLSETSATITWTTDEPCLSEIEYGSATMSAHGQFVSYPFNDSSYLLSHCYELRLLTANTTYYFRARSIDKCGNEAASENFTFTTLS